MMRVQEPFSQHTSSSDDPAVQLTKLSKLPRRELWSHMVDTFNDYISGWGPAFSNDFCSISIIVGTHAQFCLQLLAWLSDHGELTADRQRPTLSVTVCYHYYILWQRELSLKRQPPATSLSQRANHFKLKFTLGVSRKLASMVYQYIINVQARNCTVIGRNCPVLVRKVAN